MRTVVAVILLLSSLLWAETQEAAYFRAMKAEEAGDVASALAAFEAAVALPGPYTEEIREIIEKYYSALGMTADEKTDPWSFRLSGDAGFYGLRYSEFGGVDEASEQGVELFLSLAPFLDYSTGEWIHSFGIGIVGDWFVTNDDMPILDTNDWSFSVGLEYLLVGRSVFVDLGVDLGFSQGESAAPSFYGWFEKDFYRIEKQRLGMALWGYFDSDGPLNLSLYGAWHRTATYGWNANAYLGMRFEADSVVDYVSYLAAYQEAREGYSTGGNSRFRNPMEACLEIYGEQCFGWEIAAIDSLYWSGRDTSTVVDVPWDYAMWLGPTLRSQVSYRFRRYVTLEARLNLFYGFVLSGPDDEYERIGKFSGNWSARALWKLGTVSFYLGVEQLYRHYDLPAYYLGIYPKNTLLTELKAGLKIGL